MAADSGRGSNPDILGLLRDIRADQVSESKDRKAQHRYLTDTLSQQNTALTRLSSEVAELRVRTAAFESEQEKISSVLLRVKERQDSCVARLTHADDSTEIRDLRTQLQKATQRHYDTPVRGTSRPPQEPSPSWWYTRQGKALIAAIASVLMAILGMITPWSSLATGEAAEPAPRPRPVAVQPSVSIPSSSQTEACAQDSYGTDADETPRNRAREVAP